MTTEKIQALTATETFNKIEITKSSINKIREYLKWNSDSCVADDFRDSLNKRQCELVELQDRLDNLYNKSI